MLKNKVSIVVADDDHDDQFIVQQAIREVNSEFECTSVYNGIQLMDLLTQKGDYSDKSPKPTIVLLDLNMPLLDGFGALSKIKEDVKLQNIPVYILSTSRNARDILRSKELGAREFYSKPSEYEKLKRIISEICYSPEI